VNAFADWTKSEDGPEQMAIFLSMQEDVETAVESKFDLYEILDFKSHSSDSATTHQVRIKVAEKEDGYLHVVICQASPDEPAKVIHHASNCTLQSVFDF
jgi:hypothetical protein